MDPMDFAIYRALSPGGEARFWAGRRVIDPRRPARAIADAVGLSENGVRARLRGLTTAGFLRGTVLQPNPSLFGVGVHVVDLPVPAAPDVARFYRDLALLDGVVFARDTLDEGTRRLQVYYVAESAPAAVRRAALLRRLHPEGRASAPRPYWIPPCSAELSPLDWRLVRAGMDAPDGTPEQLARAVRVSLKTAARRFRALLDARAVWWTHGPEAEEFPLQYVTPAVVVIEENWYPPQAVALTGETCP